MSDNKIINKIRWGESPWWIVVPTIALIVITRGLFEVFDIVEARVLVVLLVLVFYIVIIEKCFKTCINRLTYRLKHGIAKHERMISIYTVVIAAILIAIYEILRWIGRSTPLYPLLIERKEYYAVVISLCSLVVALLLSLKLDIKKIESGEDFLAALRLHAKDLQRKSNSTIMEELHIYTPNINIGVSDIFHRKQKHCTMYNIISECNRVKFIFHCPYYRRNATETTIRQINIEKEEGKKFNLFFDAKKTDEMLKYLWDNYFAYEHIHGGNYKLASDCIADLNDMFSSSNVEFKEDNKIEEKMVGFRSKYEMVLGQYSDMGRNKHTGEVDFHGEVVTISEFIDFVPKIEKWN